MTLLPQVRNQLDSAAHRQAARPGRARAARIADATRLTRIPSLSGVITAITVIIALGIGAGAIALLSHHSTPTGRHRPPTKPVSRPTPSASATLPKPIRRLEGRPIVITIWATWCRPCRADLSLAESVAPHYDYKVAFIAGDYQDTKRLARIYVRQHHITLSNYPAGDLKPLLDPAHVTGVPTTLFVNAYGRVTHIHLAEYRSAAALEHDVATYALSARTSEPPPTSADQTIAKFAASQFAVFARPQTAQDRSLPAILRQAVTLGGLGSGFQNFLNGVIPSLTRYTQTLSDGREVFLTVSNPDAVLPPGAPRRHRPPPATTLIVGVLTVQPEGKWTDGQPVMNPSGGESARAAYITARTGGQGCALDTYWSIVPNQVTRIRWQFGRQDRLGYVFKAPLTVDMTIHGNVAVTTIPQRASCDRPAAVTLYGRNGEILSQTGSPKNLDRITRPVRPGNPFLYKSLFHRPARAAAKP